MDGGVLSVPYDRLTEFYKVYVDCVNRGELIFVVEQKTDIYNFFVDIDYKDSEALSLERIEKLSRVICEKVNSLGGGDSLVSISKPKMQNDQVKSGVHINWPNFPVDQTNAVYLRKHIINTLTTLYPTENWEKIIDNSVYGNPEKGTKGSGFRMPWSHKKGKHADCGGSGCPLCEKSGKITEVAYLPIFKFMGQGPFKLLERVGQEPSVEMLFAATIRSDSKESRTVEPPDNLQSRKKKEGSFTREQAKNEVSDPEILHSIEKFINGMSGHEKARITKIFKSDKSDAYFVGTDSSYCENVGGSHSSNHVWFLIQEKDMKVSQKCFCRCETLRKNGFCKDFTGKSHCLTPTIGNKLFPNKKSDKVKWAIAPNVSVYNGVPSRLDRLLLSKTRS
jgi:hypothetical protein